MLELIYALWRRDMIKFLRDKQALVASLARPFFWLFALGFGLRGSVRFESGGVDFVSFLVPGMAAMTVLFASMFAAISIVWDREFGFLKELLVAPVPRGAIVAAKMAAGSTMAGLEAAFLLAVAPLVGAQIRPVGALLTLLILLVFGMAVNALGIAIASGMKTFEGFGGVVNFLIQPIFFLSGALYPLEGLPGPLRVVVLINPMSYVVDVSRGLCIGENHFPIALDIAIIAATTVIFAVIAIVRFQKMEA